MKLLTMADAAPILAALQNAGYNPKVVGSVATKGQSDNDIDIALPIPLERDNSDTLKHGVIIRDTTSMAKYRKAMYSQGFELAIAAPFAAIDTWRKDKAIIDIWFVE
jgi:hypothetical protein